MLTPGIKVTDSFAHTDRGLVRSENQDSVLLHFPGDEGALLGKGALAIVADGVGGGSGGKTASDMAVSSVRDCYYSSMGDTASSLRGALVAANGEIFAKAAGDPSLQGMATTCTALVFIGGEGFLCHVGDSRAYLLRNGELRQITEDHTLVARLLSDGHISAEAAANHPQKNIIMKALGSERELAPDTYRILFEPDDIVMLCSDGLHGLVGVEEIAARLESLSPSEAGLSLVESAKARGGTDNISVVILKLSQVGGGGADTTKPYPVQRREMGARRSHRDALILAVVAALILGGIFFYWVMHGLEKSVQPDLGDLIKVVK